MSSSQSRESTIEFPNKNKTHQESSCGCDDVK